MIDPSKAPNFSEIRQYQFDELSSVKGGLFNFFYNNNDIFQEIHQEDAERLDKAFISYATRSTNIFIGSYVGILFTNNVLMRNYPKIPNYRFMIFAFKYVIAPVCLHRILNPIINKANIQAFESMGEKYNFGYSEFNRAVDKYERAYQVGRLEELMEKRGQFDWSGVPELKSKYLVD